MKKYVFVYYNGQADKSVTQEEIMESWNMWFKELGSALVDGGNPFADSAKSVSLSGVGDVEPGDSHSVGYTIVEANDIDAAVELAKGCPMHKHSSGRAIVHVYEAMPM